MRSGKTLVKLVLFVRDYVHEKNPKNPASMTMIVSNQCFLGWYFGMQLLAAPNFHQKSSSLR